MDIHQQRRKSLLVTPLKPIKRFSVTELEFLLKDYDKGIKNTLPIRKSNSFHGLSSRIHSIAVHPCDNLNDQAKSDGEVKTERPSKAHEDQENLPLEENDGLLRMFVTAMLVYFDVLKTAMIFIGPCVLFVLLLMQIPWGSSTIRSESSCGVSNLSSIHIAKDARDDKSDNSSYFPSESSCSPQLSVNTTALWLMIEVGISFFFYISYSLSVTIGRSFSPKAVFRAQFWVHISFVLFFIIPATVFGVYYSAYLYYYFGEFMVFVVIVLWMMLLGRRSKGSVVKRFAKSQQRIYSSSKSRNSTKQFRPRKKGMKPWAIGAILAMCFILYTIFLIPYFRVAPDIMKIIIRLVIHPIIKATSESIFRDQATLCLRVDQIYARCTSLFGLESVLSLIGRFFISGQSSVFYTIITIILIGCQEFFLRVYIVELELLARKILRQPPLKESEIEQLQIVVAIDSVSDMSIEIWSIIVSGLCSLMMYQYPMTFDVGFDPNNPPLLKNVIGWICLQLLVEIIVSVPVMIVQMKRGIPMVNVSADRPNLVSLFFICASFTSLCGMLASYKVVSIVSICSDPYDVCSCLFADSTDLEIFSCLCNCG